MTRKEKEEVEDKVYDELINLIVDDGGTPVKKWADRIMRHIRSYGRKEYQRGKQASEGDGKKADK